MNLSLRAKFLILSGLVQGLVLSLLIWNSLRLMDDAVSKNAYRVAHEYAVALNLSLSPYANSGHLPELKGYLSEMLSDPKDSFVRYILVADQDGRPLLQAGEAPADMAPLFKAARPGANSSLELEQSGAVLHARAPFLLNNNLTGTLNFGVSTADLALARDAVLTQGSLISIAGFLAGMVLFSLFTLGIGRRLTALTGQSRQLALGNFDELLPESGGDELEVFSHSLNTMSTALRERIAQLGQTEQRLRESEARFRILFDTAPVPLTVTDRDGVLMACNLAWTRSFGHQREEVLGKRSSELNFWKDPGERARIWGIYAEQGIVQGEIAAVCLADGRSGEVAIWSSSLALGEQPAIVWALLDMTEELNAKRELKALNASLESRVRERSAELERTNSVLSEALDTLKRTQHDLISAEKMASLGSLVAGIAHELNTPIGNSLLAATTLSDRVREFERSLAHGALKRSTLHAHLADVELACGLISGSLHRAAALIASFKQVAVDQTSDQRRVFDLEQVLRDTLATFAPSLRRANCSVSLEVGGVLRMDSFPGSLYQVVNNLINNALIHAFEGRSSGHIALSARELDQATVEIIFKDDGAGMPDDVLRHVFDPFFTTKMGQGGTGLGMNIVYNIVKGMLGGNIGIETAPGQGTAVTVVIPKTAPLRESGKKSVPGLPPV